MRAINALLVVICICGLVCLFAFASAPASSDKEQAVIYQANAHSPPLAKSDSVALMRKSTDYKFDSASTFARGLKSQPEVSPLYSRKITLHNKDEPVLRE